MRVLCAYRVVQILYRKACVTVAERGTNVADAVRAIYAWRARRYLCANVSGITFVHG